MQKAVYVEDVLAEVQRMNNVLHPCDRLMVENLSAVLNVVPAVDWLEDGVIMGYKAKDLLTIAMVMQQYQITPQDIENMCDNIARCYKFVLNTVEHEYREMREKNEQRRIWHDEFWE